MDVVFLLLSAALLLLAVLLLWFVPHLLSQQEKRAAQEAQRLRNMLSDVLGEQEAVARRQMQFGTSVAYLQTQLEELHESWPTTLAELSAQPAELGRTIIEQLDTRLNGLHNQLEHWLHDRQSRLTTLSSQENESWAYLMSLLGTMQDQLGSVGARRRQQLNPPTINAPAAIGGSAVVHDLRDEVESLRSLSEEIAALQWRLRRSVAPTPTAPRNGKSVLQGQIRQVIESNSIEQI